MANPRLRIDGELREAPNPMSRSIHTTRKSLSQIAKKKFASAKERKEALDKAVNNLRRKRRIKQQIADERGRETPPYAGSNFRTIPIQKHNTDRYVHHLASVADLRAILEALPASATGGISEIQLILGKEFNEEEYADEHEERDPFTGRLGHQTLPGVYSGVCLGTYTPGSAQVSLHAYVYG